MSNVIDLDGARIAPYMIEAIDGFLMDPPDSDFQRGFLAALLVLYREGLGRGASDARLIAADRLVSA